MLSTTIRLHCPAEPLRPNQYFHRIQKPILYWPGHYPARSVVDRVCGTCFYPTALRASATGEPGACPMSSDVKVEAGGRFTGVVVGGTFDRLHEGHEFLLKTAVEAVAQGGRLLVGIATGPLLSKKLLPELIEPCEYRLEVVEQFLRSWARDNQKMVDILVLPITEAAPRSAILDPTIQCIVASKDTENGAQAFNDARVDAGVPSLTILVVGTMPLHETIKVSSSHQRRQLLGTFLHRENQERLVDTSFSTGPYMIGLTGGIAAGKSFVRDLMKEKGVEVLDCDSLAHLSYIPGTPTYHSIVKALGPTILLPDGLVDRRVLSSIVFSDPLKMDMLTAIVWPAVSALVAEAREAMAEQGIRICLAEAALLLEAHWQKEMHEVWVVFTPHETARARLMSRNHLTEEEANKRINSQMASPERVALADVVIYNGWTQEETGQQVDKAWELLQERLVSKESNSGTDKHHPLWVRWAGLMKRLQVDVVIAMKWWHALATVYETSNGDGRSLFYIQALYQLFHQYAHFISDHHVVQLSIFFHDLAYEPCRDAIRENEAKSLLFFKDFAKEAKLEKTVEMRVIAMILYNVDHRGEAQDGEVAPFLDEPRILNHLISLRRRQADV